MKYWSSEKDLLQYDTECHIPLSPVGSLKRDIQLQLCEEASSSENGLEAHDDTCTVGVGM